MNLSSNATLILKVAIAVLAIAAVTILATLGSITGADALDFDKWVVAALLGGIALVGAAKKVSNPITALANAFMGDPAPSTGDPTATPITKVTPKVPPVVGASLMTLCIVFLVGLLLCTVGCTPSQLAELGAMKVQLSNGLDEVCAARALAPRSTVVVAPAPSVEPAHTTKTTVTVTAPAK